MASKFSAGDQTERNRWPLMIVAAALAAAAPLTAAVYGEISRARELEVTERKQEFDTRIAFLDRAIDSKYVAEDRARALRFLRAVSRQDTAMRAWTDGELRAVEGAADTLKKQAETLKNENAKLKEVLDETLRREQAVQKTRLVQKELPGAKDPVAPRDPAAPKDQPVRREQVFQKPAAPKREPVVKEEPWPLSAEDEDERRKL